MMPPYPIHCTRAGCARLAVYKLAARWSDGTTSELKTYALSCAECLPEAYRNSCVKQTACRLARGETLRTPGIYLLVHGQRDQELPHCLELERQLTSQRDAAAATPTAP
jgi:hypothetical protein